MPRIPTPLPPSLWSDGARRVAAVIAMLAVAAIGFGAGYLVFGNEDEGQAPTPTVIGTPPSGDGDDGDAAYAIGGTRNTTRFAGTDAAATAAAITHATHPGEADRPQAVVVAPSDSWQLALAASPLVAEPVGAPILLGSADGLPAATTSEIERLRPSGLDSDDGTEAIAIGGVEVGEELKAREVDGEDPAEVAASLDEARAEITGERHPEHLLVVSSEEPGYAMPAAAWAAHSGDPVLFTTAEELPQATADVIERHPKAPVYVLGPEAAISKPVLEKLKKVASSVSRISAEEPIENAIAFARYADGSFGWDINDPGHGFAIASVEEPISAAIAAPLAVSGKPGPLLVTTDSQTVPAALQSFLADTQPGFADEPTRAIYNHVWLIGGPAVISDGFQEQVDVLTNLVPIDDPADTEDSDRRKKGGRSAGARD